MVTPFQLLIYLGAVLILSVLDDGNSGKKESPRRFWKLEGVSANTCYQAPAWAVILKCYFFADYLAVSNTLSDENLLEDSRIVNKKERPIQVSSDRAEIQFS